MSDPIDQAQAREQMDRDLCLAAHHERVARQADRQVPLDGLCIDCDEPIEPERIALLRVTSRCASCALDFERRLAMQGRRP